MLEDHVPLSWRTILQEAIRTPTERKRIAQALHVNVVTLGRWVRGESQPRLATLRLLPLALPAQQERLRRTLEQEFPTLFEPSPGTHDTGLPSTPPLDFLLRVCEVAASTPEPIYQALLPEMVVQQALKHLDPQQTGMFVEMAFCTPPAEGEPVRSLVVSLGRGTPPFRERLDTVAYLVGIESLMGVAAQSLRPQANQTLGVPTSLAPGYAAPGESSAIAAPLMRAGRIAGSLCASSSQACFFTPAHQMALTRYAQVLALLLDTSLFIDPAHLQLGVLPYVQEQQQWMRHYWPRVNGLLQASARQGQAMSMQQAERQVLQQLERELLEARREYARTETSDTSASSLSQGRQKGKTP